MPPKAEGSTEDAETRHRRRVRRRKERALGRRGLKGKGEKRRLREGVEGEGRRRERSIAAGIDLLLRRAKQREKEKGMGFAGEDRVFFCFALKM